MAFAKGNGVRYFGQYPLACILLLLLIWAARYFPHQHWKRRRSYGYSSICELSLSHRELRSLNA